MRSYKSDSAKNQAPRPAATPANAARKLSASRRKSGLAKSPAIEGMVAESAVARQSKGRVVELLDSKSIARSRWANRHPESFESAEYLSLKSDIARCKMNLVPIKVRPRGTGSSPADNRKSRAVVWEVIFGHRRHQACVELGLKVWAEIATVDDHQLVRDMHAENRHRQDLSAFERGLAYAKMLAPPNALYTSKRALALAIGVDVADVSRTTFLAYLPHEILATMRSPLDIAIHDVDKLRPAYASNPEFLLARARSINENDGPLPAKEAIMRLTKSAPEGVGASNTNQTISRPIAVDGRNHGQLIIDDAHRVSIRLALPLTEPQIDTLETLVCRFVRKAMAIKAKH